METPEQIEKLAQERIEEAEILYKYKKYDGAYYLSGYSIELLLKAKICRLFCIQNLFSNDEKKLNTIDGVSEVRKALKTHNLFTLLIFSGLREKYDNDKATNKSLSLGNSKFFQDWSENLRYNPCGTTGEKECTELLKLLTSKDGILEWIKNN